MHVILWTLLVLLVLVLVLGMWIAVQYRRFRRDLPQPPYKEPAQRLDVAAIPDDGLYVGWIGHSTLYIRWNGIGIVTDPVFSRRIGVRVLGLWTIGPRRHTGPAVDISALQGKVDLILLSHAHMDHVDLPSLRRLAARSVEVVAAVGTSRLLRGMGFGRVRELGSTDTLVTECGVKVTAVPVRHWGARFPWNKTYQWTGYVLEFAGRRLFFAGDTAYVSTFTELRRHGEMDVVCMPIGAYAPESFQRAHCTPEQAWQMFLDTGGRCLVPMHWDTFVLSREPVDEPLQRLLEAAGEDAARVVVRRHGELFRAPDRQPEKHDPTAVSHTVQQ